MSRNLTGILGMALFAASIFISGCIASTSDSTESAPDIEAEIESSEAALVPDTDAVDTADALQEVSTAAPGSHTEYRVVTLGACGICQDLSYNDGIWYYYQKRTCNAYLECSSWSTYAKNCGSC